MMLLKNPIPQKLWILGLYSDSAIHCIKQMNSQSKIQSCRYIVPFRIPYFNPGLGAKQFQFQIQKNWWITNTDDMTALAYYFDTKFGMCLGSLICRDSTLNLANGYSCLQSCRISQNFGLKSASPETG